MVVEKEHVFNPHERAALSDTAEEPVDNSRREIGMEARRSGGPGAGPDHNALEEECDRQSAEVTRQWDDEETAGTDSEEVADHGSLDCFLGEFPLPGGGISGYSSSGSRLGTHIDCGITVMMAVPPV